MFEGPFRRDPVSACFCILRPVSVSCSALRGAPDQISRLNGGKWGHWPHPSSSPRCRFQKTAAPNVRSRMHYSSKGGLNPSGNDGRQAARSSHCPSNPDSGHPGEAVCSLPMCRMGRMSPPSCRLLLFLSCYLALRVVPASKQYLVGHVIRHSDVMRKNCRQKTKLCFIPRVT